MAAGILTRIAARLVSGAIVRSSSVSLQRSAGFSIIRGSDIFKTRTVFVINRQRGVLDLRRSRIELETTSLGALLRGEVPELIRNEIVDEIEDFLTDRLSARIVGQDDPEAIGDPPDLEEEAKVDPAVRAEGRAAATRRFAELFAAAVVEFSPEAETGRYDYGWADAFTKAGLEGHAPQPLRRSQFAIDVQRSLEEQADFWRDVAERRRRPPNVDVAGAIDAVRRAAASQAAARLLESPEAVILSVSSDQRTGALLVEIEVRPPAGGEGGFVEIEGQTTFRVVNLAPHADDVERRHRVRERAAAAARRRMNEVVAAYRERIQQELSV